MEIKMFLPIVNQRATNELPTSYQRATNELLTSYQRATNESPTTIDNDVGKNEICIVIIDDKLSKINRFCVANATNVSTNERW